MKRRKFLLTSGTALLGSTALTTTQQQPVLGLNFDLVGTESVQPSNADSILIDFQNFELIPKYVDENATDATVTITLDVEGFDLIQNQTSISFENGVTKDKSDLGTAIPIVLDGVNTSENALNGSIKINIEHPSVSDSYKQSFTITDDPLQQGLVGWWPLHEWSGRANDISGKDNHGSLNGVTQGKWGRSGLTGYRFNQSSVDIPESSEYQFSSSDDFTISLLIRPEQPDSYEHLISYGNSGGSRFDYVGWRLRKQPDEKVQFLLTDSSDNSQVETSSLALNEWHHVCIAYRGSSNRSMEIYVDGNRDNTAQNAAQNIDYSSLSASIGQRSNGGQQFDGSISNVRIYNRDLSENEIQDLDNLYNGTYTEKSLHDGARSDARHRYKFNNNVSDSWGSNDGDDQTENGFSNDAIQNESKTFNGTSDKIDISTISSFSSWTASVWFKLDGDPSNEHEIMGIGSNNGIEMQVNVGEAQFFIYDGNTYHKVTNTPVSSGAWYHGAITWDGSEAVGYINGTKDEKISISQQADLQSNDTIGVASNGNYWNGQLDDIRIYNQALSPYQIQQLYQWGTRGKDLRERTTTKNKSDMMGWWKLNETSGSTAYDSSGNGYNGNIDGAGPDETGTVNGPLDNTAFLFEGTDDEIRTSRGKISSYNVSVVAWVKSSGNSSWAGVAGSNYEDTNDANKQYYIRRTNDDYYEFVIKNDYDNHKLPASSVEDGQWHMLTGIYDGNETKIILDDYADYDNHTQSTTWTKTAGFSIGNYSTTGYFFNGAISNVRIYDRPLTPQEVSYLYEQKF